jgi:hypothetical protein
VIEAHVFIVSREADGEAEVPRDPGCHQFQEGVPRLVIFTVRNGGTGQHFVERAFQEWSVKLTKDRGARVAAG